jgi:hypothetical protein
MEQKKHIGFRIWLYFRNGWSMYFAFVLAAVNTLTVTYYLAIEKLPALGSIFPSFMMYIVITVSVGVPLLTLIGYAHYKKTAGMRSEVDVGVETNPYLQRHYVNTQLNLNLQLESIEMLLKLSKNEKFTEEEIKKMSELKNNIVNHEKDSTFENKLDLKFIKENFSQRKE